MMKPTPEIIELARKLYDAGHRQEIQEGDWVKCDVYKGIHLVCSAYREWVVLNELGHVFEKDCIPIPDLSTCLRWLKGKTDFRVELWGHQRRETWICRWEGGLGGATKWKEAPTPEEACMKAMLKILEGEADQQRKDDEWEAIRPDPQEEGDK